VNLRKQFLAEIGHDAGFPHLFVHLDQIAFFLKNRRFQIIYANRHFFERLGFETEAEIIGKDDFELFPKSLAAKFRRDDERVLETGEEMARMVELFLSRQGLPDWFITNKMPVLGRGGKPAGVMGTVQRYNQSRGLSSADPSIAEAVKRMLERPGEIVSVTELARELQLSHRHFDRRFKEDTGLTPKQFLGRSRVQQACRLLQQTDESIGEIALDLGYCDQSAFTAQFRRRMGLTPHRYRKQFGKRLG
jgi:PAS domain S-box-containing protein